MEKKEDGIKARPFNLVESGEKVGELLEDLGLPQTPVTIQQVTPPSPIDYGRIDKQKKTEDPKFVKSTQEAHLRESPFAGVAIDKRDIRDIRNIRDIEEERKEDIERKEEENIYNTNNINNIKNININPLTPEVERSLKLSIPYLIRIRSGNYRVLQSAQRAMFPPSNRSKTLLLDLDHTLICAFYQETIKTAPKAKYLSKQYKFPYVTRPFLRTFMEKLDKYFELWIYTAGETHYAQDILSSVDPLHTYFRGALTRDNCALLQFDEGAIIGMKNINVITNRSKENILILDDTLHVWPNDLTNVVPIEAFHGDSSDRELMNILPYLIELSHFPDIRFALQSTLPLVANCKKLFDAADKN